MRIDKYLKVSRLIKRRTVANDVADAGRIVVNGKPVKASYAVKVGDEIEITFGNKPVKVRVLAVEAAPGKTLLFADRFPFRYLVEDYGLSYYAAFPGCSAETEASFETVAFLAEKTAALDLPAVLTIEGSDGQIARTVAETAGGDRPVLTMDALQGTVPEGATYLSVMEDNLAVLRRALGVGEVA